MDVLKEVENNGIVKKKSVIRVEVNSAEKVGRMKSERRLLVGLDMWTCGVDDNMDRYRKG